MKYYIIAGEASGDLHGSNLMKGLYAEDKQADVRFWGGDLMNEVFRSNQSGTGLVHHYKDGAVMGFTEILSKAKKLLGNVRSCKNDILSWNPDVVILIDYPGFNFKIAEFAHKKGFKVFYYIAPKVWASRESRINKLKAYVDKLFIVFPFEKRYFDKKGIDYIYKGNPLIEAIDNSPALNQSKEDFLQVNNLDDRPIIALLAGSRKNEISTMMSVYMEFAKKMHSMPEYSSYQFVIAGAPARSEDDYLKYIGDDQKEYVKLVFGKSYGILKHAKAAVINSGTASLEAVLIGTPQVVAYAGSEITFNIAKKIIKVTFISLGNLILGRHAFRELLQFYFTPDNVLNEVIRLIEDKDYRDTMIYDYQEIRNALGGKGASSSVAKAMIEELTSNTV
ncbi:MAG: lipid-A-disaccharide synthase [Bacteroidales bacterium]|nr:lipid-A-disaccharide synthase [Bacteroidales bacterium]